MKKDTKKDNKNIIGEAAKIYGVSPSCLRYWEKEGLIDFERNKENNYRKISYSIAERIGNIIMFRKLGILVSDLKKMPYIGLEDFDALLVKSENELLKQLNSVLDSIEQIQTKRRILDKITEMKANPFVVEQRIISAIEPYYYYDQKYVIQFLENPNRFAVIIYPDNPSHMTYGFFQKDGDVLDRNELALREEDPRERKYLRGLLKISSENMLEHNSDTFAAKAREMGYRPGELVGEYLITLYDEISYDFYEAWMALDDYG